MATTARSEHYLGAMATSTSPPERSGPSEDERLRELAVLPVRQRLMAELLHLSCDRDNGKRVLSPPPQQDALARRIGTQRETVSREMAEMARAGLLTVGRRAIVLHRPEAIELAVRDALGKRNDKPSG